MPIRATVIYQYLKLVTFIAVLIVVFLAIAAMGRSRAASVGGLDTIKAIMIAFELLNHGQSGGRLKAK
jgi:hypothetical protein